MTRRAVFIGLLGAVFICGFGFFNDRVIRQTFITGNHMPIFVYGMLVAFLLLVNPLLRRLRTRRPHGAAFTARELAVILAVVLPACYVAGRGFLHIFTSVVMMPRHYERTIPGWKKHDVIGMVPPVMLAGAEPEFSTDDILRPDEVCRELAGAAGAGTSQAVGRIRSALSEDSRTRVREALSASDPERARRAASRVLNRLVAQVDGEKGLYEETAFPASGLSVEAAKLLEKPDELDARERRRLNRHLLDYALRGHVRSLSSKEEHAVIGFVQGLGVGAEHIGVSEVPWYAWTRTLFRFWIPLVLCLSIGVIGLALVVHRQWSEHEHLPYPIVTFANSLLPISGAARLYDAAPSRFCGPAEIGGAQRRKAPPVITSRSFLIAAGVVLAIHLNNYAYQWWPERLASFPTHFDFRSLSPLFPALKRGGDHYIMNPTIYFTAIGFAYFVSTDVSFSLGIAPFVYAVVLGTFAGYGVSLGGGGHISLKIEGFLYGGAHFGMFLVILYTGRRYFSSVFRRSVGLPSPDEVKPAAVWGARVFGAGMVLFVLQLALVGLPLQWAVLYTAITIVLFVVMTRVVAESGAFFIHPYAYPGVLLWGFLGARALGPRNMLIMFIVTTVLVIDPREAVMPFAIHALKLVSRFTGGRGPLLGRTALLGGAALVLGLAVAVPTALYLQYDRGAVATGDWWTQNDPKFSYNAVVRVQDRLSAQGDLEDAGNLTGIAWLRSVRPNWRCVVGFVVAAGLVLLLTAARLRFPRWPLHPIMLIVLGTWASRKLGASFLIGCLIKVLVTKYGGAGAYRRLKPVMIGIIAGDMLGGLIPMVVGAIYYFSTGKVPKSFTVLPL